MSANKRRKLSPDERRQIHNMFSGHCAYCGRILAFQDMTVDHVRPLNKRGGTDTLDNMFPSCFECNHNKANLTVEKYRRTLSMQPSVFFFESPEIKENNYV